MFGSAVLESLIALAFLYLLLSVVCSAANEFISRSLKLRHKTLLKGLGHLLEDPTMRRKLLNHPLIKVLGEDPTHIPSRTFALALLDTIAPAGQSVPGASGTATTAAAGSGGGTGGTAEATPTSADKSDGGGEASVTHLGPPLGYEQIRQAVGNLPDSDFRSALLALVDSTDQKLDAVRSAVGNWFDSTMDRASDWYKRRTHWVLLVLACVVSVALNADTLQLAESLWRDSGLREGLVAAADNYVEGYRVGGTTPEEQATADPAAAMSSLREQFTSFQLALGWRALPQGFSGWAAKILGLLLTTMAVSLGAPFWFDVVNKVILARGGGTANAASPTTNEST